MAGTEVATVDRSGVDREAILKHLNLNPNDVSVQALLLICERYGLDPLMKHVVLIKGKPYVTRDGYLHIAHRSQQLDGIEVLDEGDDTSHWWAKVAVYRKDMSHPFAYKGRYPKNGQLSTYGPEMAIKCAEVMTLRRAFNVQGIGAADEQWDTVEVPVDHTGTAVEAEPVADHAVHEALRHMIADLPEKHMAKLQSWWATEQLPPIKKADRLTEPQIEAAMAYIESLGAAEPPSASEDAKDEHEQRPFSEPEAAA